MGSGKRLEGRGKKKKQKKKTKMIEVKMPDRESIWAIIKMFGFQWPRNFLQRKVIRAILPIFSPFFCKTRDTNTFQM